MSGAPTNAGPPALRSREADSAQRTDSTAEADVARRGEDFEHALRERHGLNRIADEPGHARTRTAVRPSDDASPGPVADPSPVLALPPLLPALVLAKNANANATVPASPALVDAPARAARVEFAPGAPVAADTPRAFEVTLNESLGVPLALRITQPAGSAMPCWNVTLISSGMNPAALWRNSGRLGSRLRARSLLYELRIETDEPPP